MLFLIHAFNVMLKKQLRILYGRKTYLREYIFFITNKIGLNLNPARILTKQDLLNDCNQCHALSAIPEEITKMIGSNISVNTAEKTCQKNQCFTIAIDESFVFEFPNAELIGNPKVIGFSEDGSIISETVAPLITRNPYRSISIRALLIKKLSRYYKASQIDTACLLVLPWGKNYFHWIADCLTRLEGLETYHKQTGIMPQLIIESDLTAWQIDSLKLLGYEPDNCIHWNDVRMKVKHLVVPSFRRPWDHNNNQNHHSVISPRACRWIRQRILSNLSKSESAEVTLSSKIYISRSKVSRRKIINENEVIKALSSFGFVAYILEDLSFSEEVRLLSQAEIVVAPHGAGLTNMIFGENLTVIEFFYSDVVASVFANLAVGLGFRYECLKCKAPANDSRGLHSDMIVDIAELKRLVTKVQEA